MRLSRLVSHSQIRILLGLLVAGILLGHTAGLINLGFVHSLEHFAYDAKLQLLMPGGQDDRIVIVDIDESSLQQEGHWPWSRHKLAHLLDRLFDEYQAKVVAFDVVFAEKDESSGLANLQRIRQAKLNHQPEIAKVVEALEAELDYDQQFAHSVQGRNVVLGYYFRHERSNVQHNIGKLPPPVMAADMLAGRDITPLHAIGYGANLPLLQQQVRVAGHFNPDPDGDGVTRRIPLLVQFQDGVYEALSLAVARQALGGVEITPGFVYARSYAGMEWLQLGHRKIPVDAALSALIPYRGRQGSFPYVSAVDVLHGKVSQHLLRGRIVLIGTTAPGLMDLRATPVQSVYPGVEIHANMIAGILDGSIKQHPAYTIAAECLLLLILGVWLACLLPRLSPLSSTILVAALLGLSVLANLMFWQAGFVLPLASTLLLLVLVYMLNMSYGYFIESRSKRHLAQLFGQYVPPELVAEMADRPQQFGLEGESRELTILFCDIRGFTTISESLDPQTLGKLMNEYLTVMTRVIHQHRGTIDKYMGDAIMAFWGAPLADAEHPGNAVNAALGMVQALKELNTGFKQKGWPKLEIGMGLNSGEMTVGNMGSEFRMAYTVLGDAVNLGARLEGLSEYYGEPVIVSESTVRQAGQYHYRELDLVRVKGKDTPVRIYAPVPFGDAVLAQELAQYEAALILYRQQHWIQAGKSFNALQTAYGERRIYSIYIERIAYFSMHAPAMDWDAVFNFENKRGAA
ncbi:adenylate/guanylate cyclase domain-containing protein [Methylobacillus arboreus]|uniref:CHASE2 domain-containing protein n=1 Tax=Methylobacillus arboreus TaxID=755170 RepID=UPI001E398B89|nr:adenylate/guanylate cyclase domain-containing protein [Methylobacillus arboreus]MCB5190337.1 adenylate/guanylate cyclase domain-containing protein [Methylobacillus arboreus]